MSHQHFAYEHEFTLPLGYIDQEGRKHCRGAMRLANIGDEIAAREQTKESGDPDLFHLAKLARVIIRLDGVESISTNFLKNLLLSDYVFLKNFYERINANPSPSSDR